MSPSLKTLARSGAFVSSVTEAIAICAAFPEKTASWGLWFWHPCRTHSPTHGRFAGDRLLTPGSPEAPRLSPRLPSPQQSGPGAAAAPRLPGEAGPLSVPLRAQAGGQGGQGVGGGLPARGVPRPRPLSHRGPLAGGPEGLRGGCVGPRAAGSWPAGCWGRGGRRGQRGRGRAAWRGCARGGGGGALTGEGHSAS